MWRYEPPLRCAGRKREDRAPAAASRSRRRRLLHGGGRFGLWPGSYGEPSLWRRSVDAYGLSRAASPVPLSETVLDDAVNWAPVLGDQPEPFPGFLGWEINSAEE